MGRSERQMGGFNGGKFEENHAKIKKVVGQQLAMLVVGRKKIGGLKWHCEWGASGGEIF